MGRTPRPPRLKFRADRQSWYVAFWDYEAQKRRYKSCEEEGAITPELRQAMLRRYKDVVVRGAAAALDRPVGTDYGHNMIAAVRSYLLNAEQRVNAGDLSEGSRKKLHDTLDKFIAWLPDGLTTGALNPRHLEQFLRDVTYEHELEPPTVNTYKQNLQSCLRWLAKARPKLFAEPELFWDSLAKKAVDRAEIEVYQPHQLQTFLARIPGDVQRLFRLTALVGGRAMEVERIAWKDVNFETGVLTIHAATARKIHRRRYVPLREIAPVLFAEMATWSRDVSPAHYERSRFWWWDWSRIIGIHVHPQALRSNFTGWALAMGYAPATVASWQGHSMQVAQDWYVPDAIPLRPRDATSIEAAMGLA